MTPAPRAVPQPVRVDYRAGPPPPGPPPPAPLRVVTVVPGEEIELAFVYKRTYDLDPAGGPPRPSQEQPPLAEEVELHEPLVPGAAASVRQLPEVIGLKTGTDVVVQGAARPPRLVREWRVSVGVGLYVHRAAVFGRRVCERAGGRLAFTPPEPFEEMPLRMENAYGGRDAAFERAFLAEVERQAPPESMRRAGPALKAIFGQVHPLMYPRNRFGKGYVLDAAAPEVEGRELPNVERPDDLLTPERLALPDPMEWQRQPLPACFDWLDASSFPRCAYLGMPPPASRPLDDDVAEVRRGLIPSGYSLGSLLACKPADVGRVVHPWASRCAQPGLCLPFLAGDEWLSLAGMDPARPEWRFPLPRERPELTLPAGVCAEPVLAGRLNLVFVDVGASRLSLVWSGRAPLRTTLLPGRTEEVAAAGHLRMMGF